MQRCGLSLYRFLISCSDMEAGQEQATLYGLDLALYTVLSSTSLVSLGTALGRFRESSIFIVILYVSQTLGDGYHTVSHLRCFVMTSLDLSFGLVTGPGSARVDGAFSLLSPACLFAFPLILHPNKQYLSGRRPAFDRRSSRRSSFLVFSRIDPLPCVTPPPCVFFALSCIAASLFPRRAT